MKKKELGELLEMWDSLGLLYFDREIQRQGWKRVREGIWKRVYRREDLILKFDDNGDFTRNSHTAYEYRQWVRAKPAKKKYLVRPIVYHRGLLITPRLPNVCDKDFCQCAQAKEVAQRLRICDWKNHGYTTSGRLKFFDSDSLGTGWYNWKRKFARGD